MLNGIDIASYQAGIDLSVIPADFVIVKATEGTGYVNPDWKRQAQQTLSTGKLLGLYHYSDGGDVVAEATHFLNTVKDYIGKAILFLDWEGQNNPSFGVNDFNWCNHWLTHVKQVTGTNPMAYFSAAELPKLKNLNFDFWIAQYANMNPTGYQQIPWNEGAYACKIRQYSSCGRLSGWNANLDINKFYGTRSDWEYYYNKNTVEKNDKVKGEKNMCAEILKVKNKSTHYYYDGCHIHGIATPKELKVVKESYKRRTGNDIKTHEFESKEDFESLRSVMKRIG